jgi:predicted peptidase
MRSTMRFATVVLMVVASLVPAVSAAAGGGGSSGRGGAQTAVVRADLVTEVTPLGWRVVAVAIEYRDRIDLRRADIPTSVFTVAATINNVTADRTVVDVYTNDAPELDRRGPRGTRGRYLIIELNPDDPNASALAFSGGINNPIPLVGAYAVTQNADVVDDRGRVRLRRLPFAISNQGVINPIVDDFLSLSYTDSAGTRLNFRLFQPQARPERHRDGFPLVVFLHGGGERGANNITQITANQGAVAFAKPQRQATNPSYVLAPQVPVGSSWTTPAIQAALLELIDQVAASFPIDEDRLYLTGLSLGGIGSFDILPKHPDLFAGALLIAATGDPSRMPLMRDVPVWATHSIDDPVVNYTTGTLALMDALEAAGARVTRGQWAGNLAEPAAEAEASRLWAQAEADGSHVLFTTYTAGTTPVSAHWSWVPTYLNDVMIDWLFSQDLQDRPTATVSFAGSAASWRGLGAADPAGVATAGR